ncbi:MAG: hypothetical protein IJ242_11845 [Clostridia bacterium]|nr:hypothetical protein [Clostridia bacterium]
MLACIGIGSNAIRLLEADWTNGQLVELKRERRGTRLFAGLVNGALDTGSINRSADAVSELAEIAKADQAERLFIMATSAVRDASNGHVFTDACTRLTGIDVEIITGEEEAVYSYFGAARGGISAVIDIGGGSTEFTLGEDDRIDGAISLQMGAVRMYEQLPVQSVGSYERTVDVCKSIVFPALSKLPYQPDRHYDWTGVGGTMTTLGAMTQQIPLFDALQSEGMKVSHSQVRTWGLKLAAMQLEERKQVVGLMAHRADIIPSGIAILDASMQCFGVESIRLSARGNLDGYLKRRFLHK